MRGGPAEVGMQFGVTVNVHGQHLVNLALRELSRSFTLASGFIRVQHGFARTHEVLIVCAAHV